MDDKLNQTNLSGDKRKGMIELTGRNIALGICLIIVSNIVMMLVAFGVYRYVMFPVPITRPPLIDIEYNSEDEHIAWLCSKVGDSVVKIAVGTDLGSGVVTDYRDGMPIIVTNYHVIKRNLNDIKVALENSNIYTAAKVIGFDIYHDIAVLQLTKQYGATIAKLEWGDYSQIVQGQRVLAIGNSRGLGISASEGIIGQVDTFGTNIIAEQAKTIPLMQITASINSGNSGGGAFDMQGRLIGINTYRSDNGEAMGYSVPINIVKPIYDAIMSGQVSSTTLEVRRINMILESGSTLDIAELGIKVSVAVTQSPIGVFKKIITCMESNSSNFRAGDTIALIGRLDLSLSDNCSLVVIMAELYNYSKYYTGEALVVNNIKYNSIFRFEKQ